MSVNVVDKSTGNLTKVAGNAIEDAVGIHYSNSVTGLAATNVQSAVDELSSEKAEADIIATAFSAASTYTAGQYCIQDGDLYRFKTTHSGTWSASDVDAVTVGQEVTSLKSGLTNLDNEVNGDATTYSYADVITIEDAVPANLADCNVKIEPVQDLHGYDKPWVGGANKNKINIADKASSTSGDVTASCSNGVITLSGTASAQTTFSFPLGSDINLTSSLYKIAYNNTASSSYIAVKFCNNGSVIHSWTPNVVNRVISDWTAAEDETIDEIKIEIATGYPTNMTLSIVVMDKDGTDTSFSPFANICPISGHTESVVTRDGKNLFDYEHVTIDDFPNTSGTLRKGCQLPTITGQTYTVKNNSDVDNYLFSKKGDTVTLLGNIATSAQTFTTASDTIYYLRDAISSTVDTYRAKLQYVQLELGSSATDYEPFRGKTYTIQLGDTIYGGTVDFDSGVMTVTKAIVDLGSVNWGYNDSNFYTVDNLNIVAKEGITNLCSCYDVVANVPYATNPIADKSICTGSLTENRIYAKDTDYDNAADFTTAVTGQTLCYELATPTTIQLTPQQIQLLKGTNTITASTGQISVTVNGVSGAIGVLTEDVAGLSESVVDRFDDVIGWSENKNLLPMTLENLKRANKNEGGIWNGNTYTHRGVAFEVLFDSNGCVSGFNVNGTPTAGNNAYIYVMNGSVNLQGNKHICSLGTPSKGSSTTFCITTLSAGWGNQQTVSDKKTISGYIGKVRLEIKDGYTASDLLYKPMMCDDTVVDLTYEPYHDVIGKSVNTLLDRVPTAPSTDGTYRLQVTVASGVPTYSWVSTT